jgi:hypothetical protein
MPIVSTYSTVQAPNTTLSRWYSDIDDLLNALPDNTTNSIQAINVRDAVYTLYEYTNLVVASQSATASVQYIRNTPTTYLGNVGGISQGSTFSGNLQDVLDRIFYPYVSPSGSLLPIQNREFGFSTQVTLNWSVVRNSNPITLISVASSPVVPTGNSQSGVLTFNGGTHSLTPPVTEVNTFVISVSDGTSTATSSVDLNWMNRIYWGSINLSSIGNPNLTFFPGSASQVATLCTDSVIYNLTGANANGSPLGSQLSTTKNKTYNGIDGSGEYLIFAWPSSVINALQPNFTVNGMQNTAFTRVRTNSPFTNQWGFSGSNYEVWVSNTRQFSPLNIIIS